MSIRGTAHVVGAWDHPTRLAPNLSTAQQDRLLIKRGQACGEAHFYPRPFCPFCFSDRTVLEEASGDASTYTFSVMRRSPSGPYAIGYVTLKEGPSMLTNFVDCAFDALAIGQNVRVRFQPTDGGPPVPMFTPLDAKAQGDRHG